MSYIGETHLKMTTRARAFYMLKSDKNDLKRLGQGRPTFIRLFEIRFHSSILNPPGLSFLRI